MITISMTCKLSKRTLFTLRKRNLKNGVDETMSERKEIWNLSAIRFVFPETITFFLYNNTERKCKKVNENRFHLSNQL